MNELICHLCNKEFKRKSELTKHNTRKNPCSSSVTFHTINEYLNMKNSELINIFKNCFDTLRDNEHLVSDKALRNVSYFLSLKLLEPQIESNIINIDNYDGYSEDVTPEIIHYVRFSKLSNMESGKLIGNLNFIWEHILSVHPKTKNIFLPGKFFDIKNISTFKKIIDKLNSFDFTKIEEDVLGAAYEDVVKDVMVGKALGQFFTPPKVKNMMVKLINPQIKEDGSTETIFDPAMGTGGFLITSSKYFIEQSKFKNISLNWNFISKYGLGGREAEIDTFQLAQSNMLISTGHMIEALEYGDSIRNPIINKYDVILANPPFGIKGLNYNEISHLLRNEYLPIKSSSSVPLFIQSIIYMLKINGRCGLVIPDGKDLFGKTTELINLRKLLLKSCELQEIIHLPNDVFTNTSVKTCVFYFTKKHEMNRVINIQDKPKSRQYNFAEGYSTSNIKFYSYNLETDEKKFLSQVDMNDLSKKDYSFNYTEYIKEEKKDDVNLDDEIETKTLGEICMFLPKSKRQASYGLDKGKYPFFKSSMKVNSFVDEADYTTESLIIGTGGYANVKYANEFSCSGDNLILTSNTVLVKYLYYYLLLNIEVLEKGFIGVSLKHLSKEYLQKISIPILSLEKQREIVEYLDFIYEKTNKTSIQKIEELKILNKFHLQHQIKFTNFDVKKLGEICKVNQGTYITSEMKIEGEYPVYGGGNISFYINQYNREDEIIIAKDGVSLDCVRYEKDKFFLNHHAWTITFNGNDINKKYLYYFLHLNQDVVYGLASGTAQKGINQANFYKIKIPILSLEKQEELVKYIEYNENIISCLEYEIKQNKILAKQFINNSTSNILSTFESLESDIINEDNE